MFLSMEDSVLNISYVFQDWTLMCRLQRLITDGVNNKCERGFCDENVKEDVTNKKIRRNSRSADYEYYLVDDTIA